MEENPELVRYLRTVELFKRSLMRWGAECCWLGRTHDKLRKLEHEAFDAISDDWFVSDRTELLVRVRALLNGLSEYRHAVTVANCRLVRKAAVIDHNKSTRGKGGKAKAAVKAAAKAHASELWPEANRKGWTAGRLWTALTDAGHEVKPDTVRKWLTALRKTGTC